MDPLILGALVGVDIFADGDAGNGQGIIGIMEPNSENTCVFVGDGTNIAILPPPFQAQQFQGDGCELLGCIVPVTK